MKREMKMKELQILDATRRKFMTFAQQKKESELSRLDDEIRRKVELLLLIYLKLIIIITTFYYFYYYYFYYYSY